MQTLIPVLIGVGAVILIAFVVVFDKIALNTRTIEYESGRAKYWHDRWDIIDGKMSNLYTKDLHDFERPKVDLHEDDHNRQVNGIVERLYELEKKEVE